MRVYGSVTAAGDNEGFNHAFFIVASEVTIDHAVLGSLADCTFAALKP